MSEGNNVKDAQVSHWDLDYMTDAQREQWLAEQGRKRHVDAARQANRPSVQNSPTSLSPDAWRWTAAAAVVVALATLGLWLLRSATSA